MKYILKARLLRNVDGLDLLLYEKTVQQTRRFVEVKAWVLFTVSLTYFILYYV